MTGTVKWGRDLLAKQNKPVAQKDQLVLRTRNWGGRFHPNLTTFSFSGFANKHSATLSGASVLAGCRRLDGGRSRHTMQDRTLTHRLDCSSRRNRTTAEDMSEIREWSGWLTTRELGFTTQNRNTAGGFERGGQAVNPQMQSSTQKRRKTPREISLQSEGLHLHLHRLTTRRKTLPRAAVLGGEPSFAAPSPGFTIPVCCHEVVA